VAADKRGAVAIKIDSMAEAREIAIRPAVGQQQPRLVGTSIHPTWLQFIRYCAELGHGEIEKLKIQDGLPVLAEVAVKKIKFTP
jgi:hypothetical protein